MANAVACVLDDVSSHGPLEVLSPPTGTRRSRVALERCHTLVADWERCARPWEAGAFSLANAMERAHTLQLRELELRNVQLDASSLERLARALTLPAECTAGGARANAGADGGGERSRSPWLRRLVLESNGLRAMDMRGLGVLLRSIGSLDKLTLRSNLVGDEGAASLRDVWPRRRSCALELTDAAIGARGFEALLRLATSTAGAAGCLFNLTFAHNPHGILRTLQARAGRSRWHTAGARPRHVGRGGRGGGRGGGRSRGHVGLHGRGRRGAQGAVHAWHADSLRRGLERRAMPADVPVGSVERAPLVGAHGSLALGLPHSGLEDSDADGLRALLHSLNVEGCDGHLAVGVGPSDGPSDRPSDGPVWPPDGCVHLTALDVHGNALGTRSSLVLAEALGAHGGLRRLDASAQSAPLAAAGWLGLLRLSRSRQLQALYLPALRGRLSAVEEGEATATLSALGSLGSLSSLGNPGNPSRLGSPDPSVLAGAPAGAPAGLRELRFDSPSWLASAPRALGALLGALNAGAPLESLDLSGAAVGDEGAVRLAAMLASPRCALRSLQLASNSLSIRAVVGLARALANNTRLAHLGLSHNSVGVAGVRALLDAARMPHSALVTVELVNIGAGAKWTGALSAQLKANEEALRSRWITHAILVLTARCLMLMEYVAVAQECQCAQARRACCTECTVG